MTLSDLDSVLEIENASFHKPWEKDYFMQELTNNEFANLIVICLEKNNNEKIVGFADYWVTFDSATICQIAIDNSYRHQGLASLLLKEIIDDCSAKKVSTLTLEVRVSNGAAIALYNKFKFINIVTKPHYYENGEDAFYMVKGI